MIEEDQPVTFWHDIADDKEDELVLPSWRLNHPDSDQHSDCVNNNADSNAVVSDVYKHNQDILSHEEKESDDEEVPVTIAPPVPVHEVVRRSWSPPNRSRTSSEDHSSTSSEQLPNPYSKPRSRQQPYSQFPDADSPIRNKPLFLADDFHVSPSNYYAYSQAHQSKLYKAPFFVLAAILVAVSAMYTSRTTVIATVEQVAMLRLNREKIADQLKTAERDIMKLKREIAAVDSLMAASAPANAPHNIQVHTHSTSPEIITSAAISSIASLQQQRSYEQMRRLRDKLKQQAQSVDILKDKVQSLGKREVLEKWGDGVYRVEFELAFPDADPIKAGVNQLHRYPDGVGPTTFVIELAPLDLMPHSVHTFLEMVTSGLLDGCSFILNALHVLKAAPLPYDGTPAAEKAKAFTAHGLESVAFKEYSADYPHKQYTVGFAADGSPSFYINTEDNSEIHVGDPCFGKVIEGLDTIRRLEACPTRNGIWFEKRIGIKHARLLHPKVTTASSEGK